MFGGADDLVIFVAFAGEEDDVAGLGQGDGHADGGTAVGLDGDFVFGFPVGGEAGANFFDDGVGVFGARIVAGENDLVGEALGDGGHLGTLGAIAIAAA